MEIYILEDNLIQQGRLEMVLSQELKKYNKDLSIVHTFDKPQQFIEAIDSTTSNQLFFLDIEIKGEKLKGLDIAKI
ncbi:MAG: DNA-binding response regulator, partial [Streptococcus salivarius]|nr:DNA-binding response regulator [Streptococcus salivarius]